MTLPPVVRIFFAIELPDQHKEAIGRYIGNLKKLSKSHGIRWSRPENLHITLQFLAEVQAEHIEGMLKEVRRELNDDFTHTNVGLADIYVFPNPYRPRVIVLDITPQDELAKIAAAIGRGIQAAGYVIEEKEFHAHLTLGRIKQPKGVDLHFLAEGGKPSVEAVNLQEVVLYRSEPHPDGSHYTVLARIPLVIARL